MKLDFSGVLRQKNQASARVRQHRR